MTKIMLVEDDKSLREIYSIRLVAEGYNIVSAGDGEEALALAAQERPDLIIADVMMPKISGFDMLDILRSQPETQNIKVIMMTALSSDDQRQRGESLGAERYLVKSQVGIEDVINTVHDVLGDKATTDAKANIETLSNVPAAAAPAAPAPAAPVAPAAQPAPAPIPAPQGPLPGPAPAPIPPAPQPQPIPAQPIPAQPIPAAPAAQPAPAPIPAAPPVQAIPPTPPANPAGGTPANFNQAPVAYTGTALLPNEQFAAGAQTSPTAYTLNTGQPVLQGGGVFFSAPQMHQLVPDLPNPNSIPMQPATIPMVVSTMPPMELTQPPMEDASMFQQSYPGQGSAIQHTQRVLPNPELSAQIAAQQKQSGGERVIQPIHDPNLSAAREEMARRFEEILKDEPDADAERQEINTRTARKQQVVQQPVVVTQTVPVVMTPVTPVMANQPTMMIMNGMPPVIEQNPVEQAQYVQLAPTTQNQQNVVANQMANEPVPVAVEALSSTKVKQAQAAQAMAQANVMPEIVIETPKPTPPEPEPAPEPMPAPAPQPVAEEQPMQEPAQPAPPPVPEGPQPTIAELSSIKNAKPLTPDIKFESAVEPIRPGYLSELEEDVAADNIPSDELESNNSAAAQMADALKDDAVTLSAQERAKELAVAEAKEREREMKMNAETLASIPLSVVTQAAANLQNNPNIHTVDDSSLGAGGELMIDRDK